MLALGLFLPLVLTALTVSWHNHDIRNIGLALVLAWGVSNATAIWLPFEYRPIIYPVLQVIIGLMAAGAWLVMRLTPGESRGGEGQILAMLVVVCALGNTAASINYSLRSAPGYGDRYLFVLVTNLTFASQCLLVTWWGVRDAFVRARGVARLLHGPRHCSTSHRDAEAGGADIFAADAGGEG